MAADKLRVEIDLQTRQAAAELKKLKKIAEGIGVGIGGGAGGLGSAGGSVGKVRALGTGLSKATVNADEFTKSLEASNARVIAFGASAGLIMQVDKAFRAMVQSAIKVEKALADVNIVMNLNNKQLQQFSKGMFKVAKETAQSFETVAEATTEFARQGLGMENTLVRTKDALILTRLTGMQAADSVKALTAAVNSFSKEGLTSTEVINKMAKVDANFAVSSEDLANAISRVGSSAVDAGVSMDQLLAITTAVQQRTARGGAVIGNAFKTIFTRIQRSDVQKTLGGFNIATRDFNGNMLDAVTILTNLANKFQTLTKAQQASVAENVAGVFQVNILRAAMADLADANSVTAKATRDASTATDEAMKKNQELQKTMDATIKSTVANLTSAGASLGEDLFGPAMQNVLGSINAIIDSFGEGGKLQGFGEGIGKNLIKGIGKFIGGPGLIIAGVAFGKLAKQLGKFASQAFKDVMGLNKAFKERAAMEKAIVDLLDKEPELLMEAETGAEGLLSVQRKIKNTIQDQNTLLARQQTAAADVARVLQASGAHIGKGGGIIIPGAGRGISGFSGRGAFGRGIPGRANGGLIPNFALGGLASAIGREISAGVPASKIKVGSSAALRSSGNPGGIGVFNTRDEPRGLGQGISRSMSMGINPKSHGIPNFAIGAGIRALGTKFIPSKGTMKTAAKGAGAGLAFTAMGAGEGLFGSAMNVAAGAGMGAMFGGGVPGAIVGGGIALLSEVIFALSGSSDAATEALKEEVKVQKELASASSIAKTALSNLKDNMPSSVGEARSAIVKGIKEGGEDSDFAKFRMGDTREFKALNQPSKQLTVKEVSFAVEAYEKRLDQRKRVGSLPSNPVAFMRGGFDSEVGGQFMDRRTDMLFKIMRASKMDASGKAVGTSSDIGLSLAQRFSPEEFSKLASTTEVPKMLAAILDVPEKDIVEFSKKLQEASGGAKGFSNTLGKALRKTVFNIENYNKGLERLREINAVSTLSRVSDEQILSKGNRFQLRLASEAARRTTRFNDQMEGLRGSGRLARANATMGSAGVASVRLGNSLASAGVAFQGAQAQAAADFSRQVADGLGKLDLKKFIQNFQKGMSEGQAARSRAAFQGITTGELSISALEKELKRLEGLANVGKIDPKDVGSLTKLEFLPKVIDVLRSSTQNLTSKQKENEDVLDKATKTAQEQNRLDLQAIRLQYVLNTQKRQESREISAALARAELSEAGTLLSRGQIGARGRNAAFSASLAADISARGIREGDYGRAFQSGFRNEFGYEGVDILEDFENGSRQVAQTMKSSFADAFQSIASGASTVQGALANMAQSILSSISSMSSQMFTNMLFSRMGMGGTFANGGYVPGYNAGGLVTGGSGHKDDVLTRMQGGEYVIKKSAVNKIGLPTLNAINGYANGGPTMGQVGLVAAGASAASGLIGAAMAPDPARPAPSRDYGLGRGQYGYFGGADPDARGADMVSGGGTRAGVSLNKAFVYYRRDPATGQLISERARPTEGRFQVSRSLSLLGRLSEDDPQTSRMFDKEQTMAEYQNYLATETQSRKDQIQAVRDQKKGRLIGAYMNAAMLIGGAKFFGSSAKEAQALGKQTGGIGSSNPSNWGYAPGYDLTTMETTAATAGVGSSVAGTGMSSTSSWNGFGYSPYAGNNANGGLARVMGGEYVMSPEAVRTHGVGFMTELNRGNVPAFANGGLYGNQTGATINNGGSTLNTGGNTSNNVKININIDKSGKAEASATSTSSSSGPSEREERDEIQNNKEFGDMLQSVVIEQIVKQQRPGGLLNRNTTGAN